jgi:hypothetical protein
MKFRFILQTGSGAVIMERSADVQEASGEFSPSEVLRLQRHVEAGEHFYVRVICPALGIDRVDPVEL